MSSLRIKIEEIQHKNVCRIDCPKQKEPIYMTPKFKDNEADLLYVRIQTQTHSLNPREAINWYKRHFKESTINQ